MNGDGPPATDIQAALTVIGRRAAIGTGVPDLTNAHFPKAYLNGADLNRAHLNGADLSGADLSGSTVSQKQSDSACGTEAKLNSGLILKHCAK